MKTILLVFFTVLLAGNLKAQYSYNTAAEFNNSYIAIPAEPEVKPSNAITIEAWIKPKNPGAPFVQTIFGHNYLQSNEAFLGLSFTDNTIIFGGGGTVLKGKTRIIHNMWTHVAVTYDRAVKSIWINGFLDTSITTTQPLMNVTDSLYIGASKFEGSMGLKYTGEIDDLRIWNKAKTQLEILRDMYVPLANMKPSGVYTGLTAAWRFNIGGLYSYDEGGSVGNSGYNRNLNSVSYYNNKTAVYYDYNSSLVLDGDGDYCTIAPNTKFDATIALTVEAWIKRDTTGTSETWQEIVDKVGGGNQSYRLYIKNNGEVTFLINNTPLYLSTAPLVTTAQWTHIAGTYNSVNGRMVVYVNGDSVAGKTVTPTPITNNPDSIYIGGTGSQRFKGQIDEVRIWKNTVRTPAEIKQNMHRNINFRSMPLPVNLALFSFDGRVDDTGSEGISSGSMAVQFRGDAYMHSNKKNGRQSASPILRDDEGDFMGATYNKSSRRFFIPDDGGVTSAYDSIYFNTAGTVSNMKVYVMMNSFSSSHTEITITSPTGISVQITPDATNGDNAGYNGSNDLMTIFDQSADTTITYAYRNTLAPFSHKIKPYQSLAAFNGINRKGWWKIKFTDRESFDQAFVHGWGVQTSTLTSNEQGNEAPGAFELKQNYPNPFNPVTKISYAIAKTGPVKLTVFDITGRAVATLVNEIKSAGSYAMEFNASSLSSGMYFYKLEAEGFTDVKKMMLIK